MKDGYRSRLCNWLFQSSRFLSKSSHASSISELSHGFWQRVGLIQKDAYHGGAPVGAGLLHGRISCLGDNTRPI